MTIFNDAVACIRQNNLEKLKEMIAKFNSSNISHLVYHAAFYRKSDAIKILIDKGGSADGDNQTHQTTFNPEINPFLVGLKNNDSETCKILIEKKAKVTVYDSEKKSSLIIAVEKRNLLIVKMILDALSLPADPEQVKKDLHTPTAESLKATANPEKEITKKDEVQKLQFINDQTISKKKTPLYIAAEKDFGEVFDLLLQHGADPTLGFINQNNEETLPIDIAIQMGHIENGVQVSIPSVAENYVKETAKKYEEKIKVLEKKLKMKKKVLKK